jgi:periplasmic divalent cation tolerance protein
MNVTCSVVVTTTATRADVDKLARMLLSNRLAACVQVTQIASYYNWNEAINIDDEYLLAIKCQTIDFLKIEQCIKDNHRYEIPEIVRLPIEAGSAEYLQWIVDATTS